MRKIIYFTLILLAIVAAFFAFETADFRHYISLSNHSDMKIPINERAPVKSIHQMEIDAPIDTVWNILTDIRNWPEWQKAVTETAVHGEIKEGTPFSWKAGGLSFKSKIHTDNPRSMFGWTGNTFGASAIHNWTFTEKDNKTMVKVEESLQGVFPRLFRKYFQRNLDAGVTTNLQELKAASEEK
ncbi:MAG: SRPBCC family protein [Lentimicrobium sp.]|jgi:uncharacterized membrane protein|nr:SRPBCC family protein [Lentimicrobium sp.]